MCTGHISQKKKRERAGEGERERERKMERRKKKTIEQRSYAFNQFYILSNYITDGLIFLTVQLVLIIICAITYHRLMSSLLLCYYLTPTFPK